MNKFNIKDKTYNFELNYGSYQIFFSGGWYIKNLDEIVIELIDIETNKNISLKSKDFFGLRRQSFIENQKAVLAFEFDNLKYSKFKLLIKNPESLILKKSHPFLFLHNLMHPNNIPLDEIMVIIK